ncbi:hypothetical protein J2X31_000131 [Flavobacterium arsenatis]|uniref:Uncharacterized protein n=1 Tax=Flavobacterium arsenatis TaxID=1484332 RepID=A0ABU1TJU3_9FLAO|nr:hypothetical protein [Flavobacterium arsenatis]MDR6966138.1 hypothetical protein [Flavobacterium arsenatis]
MNFTQLLVFVSFIVVLIAYKRNNKLHHILLSILFVSLTSEVACLIFLYHKINISLVYSITTLFHHSLWLLLLFKITKRKMLGRIVMTVFLTYGIINLVSFEGLQKFNYNTFIFGAFLYLIFFIVDSFYRLKKEDFGFFLSNNYILLFAPVLFFLGLSVIFGFKNHELSETVVFGDVQLYTVIGYFVNIVYYGLINFYMYREKTLLYEH